MRVRSIFTLIIAVLALSSLGAVSAKGGHAGGSGRGGKNYHHGTSSGSGSGARARITTGVVVSVLIMGSSGEQLQSTSDSCPIPYCTIKDDSIGGDRCATEEECEAAESGSGFPIIMALLAVIGFSIILCWAYPKIKKKCCKKQKK